jgi:hypothetical protein
MDVAAVLAAVAAAVTVESDFYLGHIIDLVYVMCFAFFSKKRAMNSWGMHLCCSFFV